MKLLPLLLLGGWLAAGTSWAASARPPLPQGPIEHPCAQSTATASTPEGHAVVATIKRVDPRQGEVEFTTETGSFLLTTAPAEMHDLRVGDQLLLCLHEEMREDKARVADDSPPAIPKVP